MMKHNEIHIKNKLKKVLVITSTFLIVFSAGCGSENHEHTEETEKIKRVNTDQEGHGIFDEKKEVVFMTEDEIPEDMVNIEILGCGKDKDRYYIECQLYNDNWEAYQEESVAFPLADDFKGDFVTWMSQECGTYDVEPPIRETFDSASDFYERRGFIGKTCSTYIEEYEFNEENEIIWATDQYEVVEPEPLECVEEDFLGTWKYELQYDICGRQYNPGYFDFMEICEDHTYLIYMDDIGVVETGFWEVQENTLYLYEEESSVETEHFNFYDDWDLKDSQHNRLSPEEN